MKPARIVLPLYLLVMYATLGVARTVTNFLRDAGWLRVTVAIAFTLAVAATLALLARGGLLRRPRAWVVLVLAAAAYAGAIYPMESPEEKVHFIEYGVVALLAESAAPERLTGWRRQLAAAVFTLAAGWLDEGIQALLPSRHYDLRDVGFNAAAGAFALTALAALRAVAPSQGGRAPPPARA
jgi:hypothetical protein